MVCGQRAYNYVNQIFGENRKISHLLSAKMPETAQSVEALQKAYQEEKFRSVGLKNKLFAAIGESYRGVSCPLHFESPMSGGDLRELADAICKVCGSAIVCAGTDETGYTLCILGEDACDQGKTAAQSLNGRGGGRGNAYQGLFRATRAQMETYFGK